MTRGSSQEVNQLKRRELIIIIIIILPSVSIPAGGLKIDENKLKGMMFSPCSQGPAGCRVAEQHWNAVPAPKLADTNDYYY